MKSNNLFELMPTSQSENVATAALAYLLGQKNEASRKVRDLLGIIDEIDLDSIGTEFTFEKRRRIDLIFETSKSLIGVEVKLGAGFSSDQLKEYHHELSKIASNKKDFRLIALVPQWQLETAKCLCKRLKHSSATSWDQLIKVIEESFDERSEVLSNFLDFVKPRLNALERLERKRSESNQISEKQEHFLDNFLLRYFSSDEACKTGFGQGLTHRGYYIKNLEHRRVGYVSLESFCENNVIEMVIAIHENLKIVDELKEQLVRLEKEKRKKEWVKAEQQDLGEGYKIYQVNCETTKDWNDFGEKLAKLFISSTGVILSTTTLN